MCHQGYNECKLVYSCYITIPIDDGFQLSSNNILSMNTFVYVSHCVATDQSNNEELEDCPESIWKWRHTSDGGVLSIRIRQEVSQIETTDLCGYICTVIMLGQRND